LAECLVEIDTQILDVNTLFSSSPEYALLASPSPSKWSAKQCIEHLNLILNGYLPKIDKAISLYGTVTQVESMKHGFIGHKMILGVLPKGGKKMKTFKRLDPAISGTPYPKVVINFAQNMKILKNAIQSSKDKDIESIRIVSAAGILLRLRLGDVYPFLLNHNKRHILQAQNAVKLCLKHKS